MKNGLSLETAAGIVARDLITRHLEHFSHVIQQDRIASRDAVAAYIDGLAGVVALTVAGGHGSKDDVVEATVHKLREAITRDLLHLKRS